MESRIWNALSLYAYALLGVFLVVTPWTPVWQQAVHALTPSRVAPWLFGGWARGTVSAVGVLDLLVALQYGRQLWGNSKKKGGAGNTARGA